jgi:hypothetical protein
LRPHWNTSPHKPKIPPETRASGEKTRNPKIGLGTAPNLTGASTSAIRKRFYTGWPESGESDRGTDVGFGSRLCENVQGPKIDRKDFY